MSLLESITESLGNFTDKGSSSDNIHNMLGSVQALDGISNARYHRGVLHVETTELKTMAGIPVHFRTIPPESE